MQQEPTTPENVNINQGLSYIHHNEQVVSAVQQFEVGELQHTIQTCAVCFQTHPVFNATTFQSPLQQNVSSTDITFQPWKIFNDGTCERCHKERLKRKKDAALKPAKFSGIYSTDIDIGPPTNKMRHQNMHFAEIPPYLKNLTTVEMALISRITVVMNVHLLRYGMLASKGHCVSLPQEMKIASSLPLLPTEVGIVVLRRKGSGKTTQYTVQRHDGPNHITMKLKGHYFKYTPNPFYKDVVIEKQRLANLPITRTELPDLPVIDLPEISSEEDKGPAEAQFQMEFPADDESTTRSGIAVPFEPRDVDMELRHILDKLIGQKGAAEKAIQDGIITGTDWQNIRDVQPLSELKTPGFFAMAFPTVFINGTCDLTVPKLITIEYEEFVQHIYYNVDGRVSKHPFLKFFLLNLGLRMKALKQGSFLVAQQLQDAHLTIPELRQNLENEDESVPRKILSVAANLPNTDPYWREKKKELDALTFFQRKEYGDLPAYFDTNSCAEFHWKPLLELLIKYYVNCTNEDENEVRNKLTTDFKFRRELILNNLHIVTSYFDVRTINYFSTVVKQLFQYNDVWWRYEFAKSRGEIHSHSIICSSKHARKVHDALQCGQLLHEEEPSNHSEQQIGSKAAEQLRKWQQTTES